MFNAFYCGTCVALLTDHGPLTGFESFWVKVKAIYKTAIRKVREHRTRGMLRD